MDAHRQLSFKSTETSKYNLRCHRSISEKMTKKDFIYDIRRPFETTRRDKYASTSDLMQWTRIAEPPAKFPKPTNENCVVTNRQATNKTGGKNLREEIPNKKTLTEDEFQRILKETPIPTQRILDHECNYCLDRLATLSSLSTHVKSHRRRYCRICYWIFLPEESMVQHMEAAHSSVGSTNMLSFLR